ncbi:class I SAM-dependent methyltransferase [Desulfitobacterium sp. Sab5]|uniref:class I SAM-dependent methyltransferase n=1 Tax=Desulfitobacterium nosdiversum TaxID=3375356 RepID=UPI003CFB2521
MSKGRKNYIPALRFDCLSPLFDPFLQLTMPENTFKRRLVEQANVKRNNYVLDLGCGTGTLTILIKKTYPEAKVFGLDADEKILKNAETKIKKTGLNITLDKGMAFELPYLDNSFDFVLSSLVFHHLTHDNKVLALKEVYRVLRPGGELHIADFGKPSNTLMYLISLIMRNFEEAKDNYQGLLPCMTKGAGFNQVQITAQYSTLFGTLSLYKGCK